MYRRRQSIHIMKLSISKGASKSRCTYPRCLKITEKVSFNIASEASYVYIMSGQKFIKMPKMVNFGEFFENLKIAVKSVTRQVTFNRTKIGGKCQNSKATF